MLTGRRVVHMLQHVVNNLMCCHRVNVVEHVNNMSATCQLHANYMSACC